MIAFSYAILQEFLSTPSARRATATAYCQNGTFEFLSTPSARRATDQSVGRFHHLAISIHALREEGDRAKLPPCPALGYFYPRPPRGGRLFLHLPSGRTGQFLSTPSARRATSCRSSKGWTRRFLSTPSARRATGEPQHQRQHLPISIHALREEGDFPQLV